MVEVPEEYVRLLEKAKRERRIVSGRTKKSVSKLQWELGKYHGSEDFFAETHLQTNVPLSGGYIEVHARVNAPSLENIFDRIAENVEKHDPNGEIYYEGDPDLLHMILEGPEGGQVHIASVPTRSDELQTHLSIKGFGNSRDVARLIKIIAEALKTMHRENEEAYVYARGEQESMR